MGKIRVTLFLVIFINTIHGQLTDQGGFYESSTILNSHILQEERKIQIYLPTNYGRTSKKYPVLYIIDAQRYFLNGVTFQQNLSWQEIVPEFIVVGIHTDAQQRRTLFYQESSKFIEFLEKELIPEIDSTYRTLNERIYFGWEMAAGFGIQLFAEKPNMFNGYLLASPTHLSKERLLGVSERLKNHYDRPAELYAVLGTVENWALDSMYSLDSLFKEHPIKNVQWKFNLSNTENHYTTPLTTINEGLKLFFGDYGPIRFYSLDEFEAYGGIPKLKEHYRKRGEKYQVLEDIHADTIHYLLVQALNENNFGMFEMIISEFDGKNFIENYYKHPRWFDRFAKYYMENDKLDEGVEILDMGLQKFPNASILHFSKGNYYNAMGKNKKAMKSFEKAKILEKKLLNP
jgi:predicted alpha/beta superfamily hydrolase